MATTTSNTWASGITGGAIIGGVYALPSTINSGVQEGSNNISTPIFNDTQFSAIDNVSDGITGGAIGACTYDCNDTCNLSDQYTFYNEQQQNYQDSITSTLKLMEKCNQTILNYIRM